MNARSAMIAEERIHPGLLASLGVVPNHMIQLGLEDRIGAAALQDFREGAQPMRGAELIRLRQQSSQPRLGYCRIDSAVTVPRQDRLESCGICFLLGFEALVKKVFEVRSGTVEPRVPT